MRLQSYAEGKWFEGRGHPRPLLHAVTGEEVAEVTNEGLDFKAMLDYGRNVGGPKLRAMTFHQRALLLKSLAKYLLSRKDEFYQLSWATGATRTDSWIDIEGGISTLFVYSSKGRRELPNETFYVEGEMEALSRGGTFVGQHICVPLEGVALHINAFNFPCWGMLEKLAPAWLAGVPAVVKPAFISSFLAEKMVHAMIESNLLPEGALQLICGGPGDVLDHLTSQDVVTFTGSAETGRLLKQHPVIVRNAVRFNMEADSLNCSILGPDATPQKEEFNLFIREVVREMTVKAGQKCTAIRRTFVPEALTEPVIDGLKRRLSEISLGDPAVKGVRMGPLAARGQVEEVRGRVEVLMKGAEVVYGDPTDFQVTGADSEKGAFFPSLLLYTSNGEPAAPLHNIEAFGPVNTVVSYRAVEEAVELAKRGKGSLVGSLFSADDELVRQVVLGVAPYHGRLTLINRHCAGESTGHGSPLPHLVHGGPGRAGGGEELGGVRGMLHYMQRTALQGSPTTLSVVCRRWMKGADRRRQPLHPFRKSFDQLQIGDSITTHRRTLTEADVVNFACLTGDHFYAHTDKIGAKDSIFEKRVAHGYLVLSAAAGLFVDPAPGPVLANYGLENLRFTQPVYIGDTIQATLTCKEKTAKEAREGEEPRGVVAWDVEVTNQDDELVATYAILTLVKRRENGFDVAGEKIAHPGLEEPPDGLTS
ncbi:MAG: phenylacetic acid degradation bifunctional protein PaaZ [Acidobacteriota bacterium]